MNERPLPTVDDALRYIVDSLKSPVDDGRTRYGYDFYLPHLMATFIQSVEGSQEHPTHIYGGQRMLTISPVFYEAAWLLCRKGIIRPGIRTFGQQATDDGNGGNGYSVTSVGKSWLQRTDMLLVEPTRLAKLFEKFVDKFGRAFLQRALEASDCHRFGNYLACCVMCGAASESILLAAAIAKSSDESQVLSLYKASNGRKRTIDYVVGQVRAALAEQFKNAMGLLSYWRDDASHGALSDISEIEAHEAIARLVRLSQFTQDNWVELTRS